MTSGFFSFSGHRFPGAGGTSGGLISMNTTVQGPQRSQQLIPPGVLLDPYSQRILHRSTDFTRKRPLADSHTHPLQGLNGLFQRSVKPRIYHQTTSPVSPPSIVDLSSPPPPSARSAPPILRSQSTNDVVPCPNFAPADPEMKMMNRLQELEKQLLDDDDYDGDDGGEKYGDRAEAVSEVTNSEWSETILTPSLNLKQNSVMASPSPPTSSSSSSSSFASSSPPPTCQMQSLTCAAASISDGNPERALEILTRDFHASGKSDQQVAAHIAAALRRRAIAGEKVATDHEAAAAMQVLCEVSSCFKVGLWAVNQAILNATSDLPEKIHVVDFDGCAAVQYLNLAHTLAARAGGKPVALKITTVSESGRRIGADERLRKLCERLGVVSLKLNSVSQGASGLSRASLGCEPSEAVVVNFAFKLYRTPDESVRTDNPRDELLRRVKSLRPRVITVVEQEMNCNTAPLSARVAEVHSYYAALLDSLDSALPRDHPDRVGLERGLSSKVVNAVACEGGDRTERCEVFGKWRARFRMAGWEPRALSQGAAESLQARVNSGTRGEVGFTVEEDNGGIRCGWMGRTLAVASAWR